MTHIKLSNYGATPFERLLGHTPNILDKWNLLENALFASSAFDNHFLEQVRRALAFNNLCQYCMAKAGPPDENITDARLREALRAANKFAIDHTSIDANEIMHLKEFFSDQEVVELIAFFAFVSAAQRFGAALGLSNT